MSIKHVKTNLDSDLTLDMDSSSSSQKSDKTEISKKPTAQELEKLKREVYVQNRKLLILLVGILVFAAIILFSASHIATWLTPKPWTYNAAVQEVADGKITPNQYVYNGLVFARQSNDSLWLFQGNIHKNLYEISMYYGPNEVSDINSSDLAFGQIFSKRAVILTLDSRLDNVSAGPAYGAIAAIELGKVLGTKNNILNKDTFSAVTGLGLNSTNDSLFITCANATKDVGVIIFELGQNTQIFARPNCIVIRGSQPVEMVRAADRFVYSLLGVTPLDAQLRAQNSTTVITETNATKTATLPKINITKLNTSHMNNVINTTTTNLTNQSSI